MDKTAIKTFAINSRRKLMEDVEFCLNRIGITKDGIYEPSSSADGVQVFNNSGSEYPLYDEDIKKRESLIKEVNNKGYENIVEEVAYTWFNRIIAIRYMEVNDYLPTKTRVLSSETPGKIEPDIITEAYNLDLDFTEEDMKRISNLKMDSKLEELFGFLFIKQCNKLNDILPGLFEKTEDYMELLLTISFVSEEGVIRNLIDTIPEEDFTNQVEIIGWLYQFYNTELKDDTFANLKKKIKISKERIPAATQLFTPDWIVKYMVENSVGRLWLEGHPNEALKANWNYFVDEAEQEPEVELKLAEIRNESANLRPEDIKVIDPCCGSGHILVYVFDVLMQIYVSEGFTEKDAAEYILKYNLYGLDIDDRAYQLSYFAVMMKARKYNRRILNKESKPLVYSIQESNSLSKEFKDYIISKCSDYKDELEYIFKSFKDAKEYGSILDIKPYDFEKILESIKFVKDDKTDLNRFKYQNEFNLLEIIVLQAMLLSYKYDVVITNPPYMSNASMNSRLKEYLARKYSSSKSDLFAVFIERCKDMTKKFGLFSMITQHSFMFLSAFESMREELLKQAVIIDMVHLGAHAFDEIGGEVVQASAFIQLNGFISNYNSVFHRLIEFNSEKNKEKEFFNENNKFISKPSNFSRIPGNPIAYWTSENFLDSFDNGMCIDEISGHTGSQNKTANNTKYLRYFWEVSNTNIGLSNKWIFYAKGGEFRRYYGNLDLVVDWSDDARDFYKNNKTSNLLSEEYWYEEGITYTKVSTKGPSFRYLPKNCIFDMGGPSICYLGENLYYILGLFNSNLIKFYLNIFNPTINIQSKDIRALPIIINKNYKNEINELVKENVNISKEDYDSSETSFSFKNNPLLDYNEKSLEECYKLLVENKKIQFNKYIGNEKRLNQIFLEIYDIDDVGSDVNEEDIKLNLFDYEETIKSFISYAVGCMLGRYSLDKQGLQFAGGNFDLNNYSKFVPDDDNILPILDTEYFEDDIVGRFVEFVKVCFGEETLEENLDFIANALKKRGNTSREIIRNYFLNDFFKDHIQTYKKCPIYWEFSSGKENGFNCLIYMHRYDSSLVARVRTEYLHITQKKIEENIDRCENRINNSNVASEKSKATKEKNKLIKQLAETREYDEALAHIAAKNIEIDLDDGVKVNYAKFQNVPVRNEGQKIKKINLLKKI